MSLPMPFAGKLDFSPVCWRFRGIMAAMPGIGNGHGGLADGEDRSFAVASESGVSRECSVVAVVGGGRGGVADVDGCSVGSRTVKHFAKSLQVLTEVDGTLTRHP